jgi:hypothetical protein
MLVLDDSDATAMVTIVDDPANPRVLGRYQADLDDPDSVSGRFKDYGVSRPNAIVIPPDGATTVTGMDAPRLPADRFYPMLGLRLKNEDGIDLATTTARFQPLADHGELVHGLLFAAAIADVKGLRGKVRAMRVGDSRLEYAPLALAKAYAGVELDERVLVAVHVGRTVTHIAIVDDGLPVFLGHIDKGMDSVAESLIEQCALTRTQADEFIDRIGLKADVDNFRKIVRSIRASVAGIMRATTDVTVPAMSNNQKPLAIGVTGDGLIPGMAELYQQMYHADMLVKPAGDGTMDPIAFGAIRGWRRS